MAQGGNGQKFAKKFALNFNEQKKTMLETRAQVGWGYY